jgi:cytochrome c-type biogenesis protein CcmH/NrfG
MKKETALLVIVILVVGGLIGAIVSNQSTKSSDKENQDTHVSATVDSQKDIQILNDLLKAEPNNRNAWVQLGNKYFDTNNFMEAIDAYDNALAIDDNDPNVLTDQGIMYRRVGWFGKAIENFTKANQIDPNHIQSLLNMGIVYRFDLEQNAKAKDVWLKCLEIDAVSPTADRVRTMIDHMENGHG